MGVALKRWVPVLVALVVLVVLAAGYYYWSSSRTKSAPVSVDAEVDIAALRAQCSTGVGLNDPKGPLVCVGTNNLGEVFANPDPVNALRRHNGKAVKLRWITRSETANLDVNFDESGCVVDPACSPGSGNCAAVTDTAQTGKKECKYTVTLNGTALDPRAIIDD